MPPLSDPNPYSSPVHDGDLRHFPGEPPSRVRIGVLAWLSSLSFVLYLDRVCIGQASGAIRTELGLSNTQMGWVLGAFTIAYGLFEVPTGRWGDKYGSRGVLTRIVIWWSLFTAITGAAWGLISLLLIRFLFGAGEAGAYPNAARVLSRWFPDQERGRAQGVMLTCAQLGSTLAPVVAAYLIAAMGWRWTFVLFGSLGIVWAWGFFAAFRDDPQDHPRINAGELALLSKATRAGPTGASHPPIPWKHVLHSPNIWLLGWVQTCGAFCAYMYMSWYPTYLQEGRGVDSIDAGWLSSLVLGGGAIGCLSGGILVDTLIRRTGNRAKTYHTFGAVAFTLAAIFLAASALIDSPVVSSCLASLACMTALSTQACWWGATTAICGRHLGALFGLMNSLGVPGAFGSTQFLGLFSDQMARLGYEGRACWDPAFFVYAFVLLTGAVAWWYVDAEVSVVPEEN